MIQFNMTGKILFVLTALFFVTSSNKPLEQDSTYDWANNGYYKERTVLWHMKKKADREEQNARRLLLKIQYNNRK